MGPQQQQRQVWQQGEKRNKDSKNNGIKGEDNDGEENDGKDDDGDNDNGEGNNNNNGIISILNAVNYFTENLLCQ